MFPLVSGPFVSALANRYGFRTVCMLGSALGAIGFVLSFFASSVTYLFFSYGVLGGENTSYLLLVIQFLQVQACIGRCLNLFEL
jgi:MFS family permease